VKNVAPRRLLIALPHSLHVRNFGASGLIDILAERGHRITLVVPSNLVDETKRMLGSPSIAVHALDPFHGGRVRQRLRAVFRTASYVTRSNLSTYRHKLMVRSASLYDRAELQIVRALGRFTDWERVARAVEARVPVPSRTMRFVRDAQPDVLVTGTFIHDVLDLDLRKAARRLGVPILAFPASWDTLTSKGCFLVPPDALMVWGEDTHRHAMQYHGYAADRVFVTGPPHFDVYAPTWAAETRDGFLSRRGIDPAKRVILFAGTTVTYMADEPLQLRRLSELITRDELGNAIVWYRPHPRRSARDINELQGLPGVYVDDQIVRHKAGGGPAYSITREDLAHYRGLIDAADGIVTAFSTMIIEAALMGKPSLVVGFGLADGTADRVLQHAEYEHMRDVISTPGVTLVKNLDELVDGTRRMMRGDFAAYSELLRKRAAEIAHAEDGRARERVIEAIERTAAPRRVS
jgi:CDP-glycerol:poly(glycerophosphate) glycerophosphotransferase